MLGAASRRVAADSASPKITQVYLESCLMQSVIYEITVNQQEVTN
jgi:hypothetical protein